MPPRLNKRQQRELEELEALRAPPSNQNDGDEHKDDNGSDDDLGISVNPPRARASATGFSALIADDLESEDDVAPAAAKSAKKNKNKKKKKSATAVTDAATTLATPATPTSQSKSEKKAEKKARTKGKKADGDELEQALADLSVKYPELQNLADIPTSRGGKGSTGAADRSLASLLAVSTSHLDAEGEMRKFFGAKVVQASKASSSSSSGARRGGVSAIARSVLTRPQSTWWPAKLREGLSIRALTDAEWDARVERHRWEGGPRERWWKVEYSKKYTSVTLAFMQTVLSGDPEGFWNLQRHLPWHADTLLQLAEVYRHREEYAQAVDFVDRALFTYERSFVGAFSFTNGMNRLDFDYVENRPFFLAVHRQVIDLQRRGCVRTAFEFARLLLSLDPWEDPHGALFHLDFLALKAGMGSWLLEMYDLHASNNSSISKAVTQQQNERLNPTVLPGWLYARALALRYDEESRKDKAHEGSTAALRLAVTSFPSVVPLLADKIDATITDSVRGHVDFRIQTEGSSLTPEDAVLHLLSHAYVQRSAPLWKADAALVRWFAETVTSSFPSLTSSSSSSTPLPKQPAHTHFLATFASRSLRFSVYRHTMVLEATHRRLFAFIPKDVLSAKALACDPLPPPTAVTEYTEAFFKGSEDIFSARHRSRQQRAADERRLERMIPDAAFRQQLQAFFEGNPNIAEQFPGGILQFAQNAARLPPDVLEGMMIAELNAQGGQGGHGGHGGGGGMPGGMPGMVEDRGAWGGDEGGRGAGFDEGDEEEGDEEGEGEGEEDSEEEDLPPMAVRVLRNIVGRFWGGANRQGEDDSDSEDDVGDGGGGRLPDLVDRDGVD
ncbi:TCF25 family protein [Pleurotus pulmonarius]